MMVGVQVREVSIKEFAMRPVRRREDCLLLYGPLPSTSEEFTLTKSSYLLTSGRRALLKRDILF